MGIYGLTYSLYHPRGLKREGGKKCAQGSNQAFCNTSGQEIFSFYNFYLFCLFNSISSFTDHWSFNLLFIASTVASSTDHWSFNLLFIASTVASSTDPSPFNLLFFFPFFIFLSHYFIGNFAKTKPTLFHNTTCLLSSLIQGFSFQYVGWPNLVGREDICYFVSPRAACSSCGRNGYSRPTPQHNVVHLPSWSGS